ncbi:hypothetical protein SUGI_1095430 [Cryptomeria japonica]|nr:hypothetical protein SUGI_1095430 [Cryptomeria japonica]
MASLLLLVSELLRKDHGDPLLASPSNHGNRKVQRSNLVECSFRGKDGSRMAETEEEEDTSPIMIFRFSVAPLLSY